VNSVRAVQIFLVATIAALIAASFYTSATIQDRQRALLQLSRYDLAFSSHQAVIEFYRLEQALLRLDNDRSPANLEEVRLRYEILYNRATVWNAGKTADFIGAYPELHATMQLFRDTVRRLDPVISGGTLALDADSVLAELAPLGPRLSAVASAAHDHTANMIALDHRELARRYRHNSVLTIGLILCGMGLVAVTLWSNHLLLRAHRKLKNTTDELERAASELAMANGAVGAANAELRRNNAILVEKEAALQAQNGLFDAALNNMSQGLCMFDDDLRAIVLNTQFQRLFGLDCKTNMDGAATACCRPSLRTIVPEIAVLLEHNVRHDRPSTTETACADGRVIAVAQQRMPQGGWVATFEDVTTQRRSQERIAHMARHDSLTDLPNRYSFRERIQEVLAETRSGGGAFAVMCLDLDHFKAVNDTLGHPAGDALLCAAAERLRGAIRDTDMIARFGGDEFAILQPGIVGRVDAERLAGRIVGEIARPFYINGEQIFLAGSLGVALSPEHGDDADILLKNADLALYAAKDDGRRMFRIFEPEMDERLIRRNALERDLRLALANGELDVHYQPVVDLRSRRITGVEGLLRWTHPLRGNVPPSAFIPIAEEAGLIVEIGRWVLRTACADAVGWPGTPKISVNLSPVQFRRGGMTETVAAALGDSGLAPERLLLEITESLLLDQDHETLRVLNELKALGVEIAMDDFGTGYSSLSYLRRYPFDRIKIDRAFIDPSSGQQGAAIIQTMVSLGNSLGMTTVAEGVETEQDREMLLAAGCTEAQGYLFSPPVPRDAIGRLLAAQEAPPRREVA